MILSGSWRRVLILAATVSSIAACQVDHGPAGNRLARELAAKFPDQVEAIEFQYSPPLDPPTLFIDLDPSMSPEDQQQFLCDVLAPEIAAVDREIAATVTYGWWSDDCPRPTG